MFALLTKIYKPRTGSILFEGKDLAQIGRREYARRVAAVHQYNTVPDDLTVRRLVSMGRTAYQSEVFSRASQEDRDAVDRALALTHTEAFAEREVKELSGGQMQRVWLALALAQTHETLLLDEITTYLDVHYQYEILDLIRSLNRECGTTVLMVLHDINQTMRYADDVVMMKEGAVLGGGRNAVCHHARAAAADVRHPCGDRRRAGQKDLYFRLKFHSIRSIYEAENICKIQGQGRRRVRARPYVGIRLRHRSLRLRHDASDG